MAMVTGNYVADLKVKVTIKGMTRNVIGTRLIIIIAILFGIEIDIEPTAKGRINAGA